MKTKHIHTVGGGLSWKRCLYTKLRYPQMTPYLLDINKHNFLQILDNMDLTDNADVNWKRHWKIDSASFQTILQLSQFAKLLKRREFMLELKRGGHARVQTKMVELIALLFQSSKKLNIWSFHIVVVQGWQKNVQKNIITCRCCFAN